MLYLLTVTPLSWVRFLGKQAHGQTSVFSRCVGIVLSSNSQRDEKDTRVEIDVSSPLRGRQVAP